MKMQQNQLSSGQQKKLSEAEVHFLLPLNMYTLRFKSNSLGNSFWFICLESYMIWILQLLALIHGCVQF